MSELNEDYLRDAYSTRGMSTYEIAQECHTYPNKVRRALMKYGLVRRDKSEAQANALKQGRHKHPTKGTQRSESTRIKISEKLASSWKAMSDKQREHRVETARVQWMKMSEAEQEEFKRLATEAVRAAATNGSKLEKFILSELRQRNYNVIFHAEQVVVREQLQIDLFLPDLRVAIEIDGPAHFYPIWGQENLAKHLVRDNVKTGLLLQAGYVMIRIKHIAKNLSKIHERHLLTKLLQVLESISGAFPADGQRLIEIEVK